MSRLDLKPCPFCGKKAKPVLVDGIEFQTLHVVFCSNEKCDVRPFTKRFKTKEEAIKAWNRRADNEAD